ncbi:outer membrane protein assembly factor [Aggregicoccus sp. 17bor-14]|uniref:POTRA domain-containing protein n=1 Tax=Myxococcaceae TaxID=31 RepID=UPI00129C6E31|nr:MULTISPECIES: POTRA domain-containing protein [Myxococcaceae]MBF5045319.1 outer membrane protein assembly factor [Simulacricoccus sp. 17bor-14]MRI91061.1 outer membrane protein assembly factor [Aggregicoccus sp. 17bor-14]
MPSAAPTADRIAQRAVELTVARIEVAGNARTRTSVIRQAMRVSEGDALEPGAPAELERRLLNLRLFRSARVELRPEGAGAVLHVQVEERWTLLPIPFYSRSEGRWAVGLYAVESNLLGLRKLLVLGGSYSNRGGSLFGLYRDPGIRGTRWTTSLTALYADTDREHVPADVTLDRYTDRRLDAGGLVGYQLTPELNVAAGGFALVNRTAQLPDGAPPPGRSEAYGPQLALDWAGQDYRVYFNEGLAVRARLREALSALGSMRPYRQLSLAASYTLSAFRDHALSFTGAFDVSHGDPVLDALQLGGRPGTRGFVQGGLWASEAASLASEYQVPLWRPRWGTLTAQAFLDVGVARWQGTSTSYAAPGLGMRIYLHNVAVPALGVDVARAPLTGKPTVSVAAGLSL